jgi:hypothetical protein
VRKIAAFIFAAKNIRSEAALGYGKPEFGGMRFGRNIFDADRNFGGLRRQASQRKMELSRWTFRSFDDLWTCFARRTADDFAAAIDDELRCVDTIVAEGSRVSLLPLGPMVRGKRIGPAEPVPVVDMLFDGDDFDVVHLAGVIQSF